MVNILLLSEIFQNIEFELFLQLEPYWAFSLTAFSVAASACAAVAKNGSGAFQLPAQISLEIALGLNAVIAAHWIFKIYPTDYDRIPEEK